jgi:hypothetical protein
LPSVDNNNNRHHLVALFAITVSVSSRCSHETHNLRGLAESRCDGDCWPSLSDRHVGVGA